MSRYIDVSMPIVDSMLVWPTDPPLEIRTFKSPIKGDRSTVSQLSMGTHTGTHVDAPKHFLPEAEGVETLDPEVLIGPCLVLDVREAARRGDIGPDDLAPAFQRKARRIILRTGTLEEQMVKGFSKRFPGLTVASVKAAVEQGVRLIGIDAMSIEIYHAPGAPTHHALLEARVIIIENLLLKDVPQGQYDLIALPLRIQGGDGAPARVFLRTIGD